MAKKKEVKLDVPALLAEMRTKGIEQELFDTHRKVRLRYLEPAALLREGKMPDNLTPLVMKSVYGDIDGNDINKFLYKDNGADAAAALAHLETIDFVVKRAIADNTKVEDLTLGEKRWIFRLVMGDAETLATFRLNEDPDVGDVDSGEDVPSATA